MGIHKFAVSVATNYSYTMAGLRVDTINRKVYLILVAHDMK